jgi:tetratricopeptide (TPR) repeat protein
MPLQTAPRTRNRDFVLLFIPANLLMWKRMHIPHRLWFILAISALCHLGWAEEANGGAAISPLEKPKLALNWEAWGFTAEQGSGPLILAGVLLVLVGLAGWIFIAWLFARLLAHVMAKPPQANNNERMISRQDWHQLNQQVNGVINLLEETLAALGQVLQQTAPKPSPPIDPGETRVQLRTEIPSQPASQPGQASSHGWLSFMQEKAKTLLELDRRGEALCCYEQILARFPDQPEIWIRKAAVLEQNGNSEEALDACEQALERDPSLSTAYLLKGRLLNQLHRHQEALQCYDQALQAGEGRGRSPL